MYNLGRFLRYFGVCFSGKPLSIMKVTIMRWDQQENVNLWWLEAAPYGLIKQIARTSTMHPHWAAGM